MLNQRGILRAPDFALPRTSTRTSQAVEYRFRDARIFEDVREQTSAVAYIKMAVCIAAIVLGVGIGVITPILVHTLQSWQF